MRRMLPVFTALALLALAPAAQARAPRAVLISCDRTHHVAVFEGRMDAVRGAVRMQMRFRLQALEPDDLAWRRLKVPGFSSWVTSDPGRSRYVYTRRVEQLLAPADYRVQVRFRWLDADGDVVATAQGASRVCHQPDPRPDLRVNAIEVRPAAAQERRRYAVTVRNAGRSAAPASTLRLDLADGTSFTAPVGALDPREETVVTIGAPACTPGDPVTATADALDVVDERDEFANALSMPCPAAS